MQEEKAETSLKVRYMSRIIIFFDLDCYKVTLDNLIDKIKSHGNLD